MRIEVVGFPHWKLQGSKLDLREPHAALGNDSSFWG